MGLCAGVGSRFRTWIISLLVIICSKFQKKCKRAKIKWQMSQTVSLFLFYFLFFLLISVLACEVITAQKSNSFYLGHSPRVCHNKTPS